MWHERGYHRISSIKPGSTYLRTRGHARAKINEHRINILRDGEHCVCHLESHLGLRQSYISQQLAVLREAGLIQDRRDGWNIFYRVANPKIYAVLDAVQQTLDQPELELPQHAANCPCPKCSAA